LNPSNFLSYSRAVTESYVTAYSRGIGILTAAQRIVNRYYVLCEAIVRLVAA
jgi:hypothetical protein